MSNLKLVPYTNSKSLLAVRAEVPSSEIDLSQLTLSPTDVKQGVKYLKPDGTFGTGTLPIQTGTITLTGTSTTLPEGYYNGNTITLGNTDLANLVAANIKAGVPILGVTGSYTGDLKMSTKYIVLNSQGNTISFDTSHSNAFDLDGATPKFLIFWNNYAPTGNDTVIGGDNTHPIIVSGFIDVRNPANPYGEFAQIRSSTWQRYWKWPTRTSEDLEFSCTIGANSASISLKYKYSVFDKVRYECIAIA